ncbi:rhodanese-like domain-containing protein [Sulfurospirillum diekertiae]|uniref:Thiosulfate sulfurtransferase GlpE n=1 Tax=Sulfurospirillum diekertiae TaxID=1854492 RepID=A0A1Y0HJR7_9BACT|nr:rhodanese-like domain-containing protein [Sulfurospirillum diekertiae]ARU48210.1 Thiosulfate sulfurtransferase GlpE [Sulfurospirillum diekertiae]ASC93053.1 Thiosulfate sulfurtransferase GlpE [Sulfurospirillum diekertiae]
MKKVMCILLVLAGLIQAAELKKVSFDEYLSKFDYKERENMKIKTPDMLALVEEGKAILLDIRFREEFEVWHMNFAINIPLNELPKRLGELPKDKLIITACPHYDRSSMARIYLTLNGYNAKYLNDGLLKTADFLRGDNAKEFLEEYKKNLK